MINLLVKNITSYDIKEMKVKRLVKGFKINIVIKRIYI